MDEIKKPWWSNSDDYDPTKPAECGRIWHNYTKWEDAKSGMYVKITGKTRSILLENAIDFTGDYVLYGKYMLIVIEMWPFSCEHNLSATCINRRAWVGHAACCYAIGVPEDITREAWGYLTFRQKKLANNEADTAITVWEKNRGRDAENKTGHECYGRSSRTDIKNVRYVQQDIFEFLRRKGFYRNASLGSGRSEEKREEIRITDSGFRRAV